MNNKIEYKIEIDEISSKPYIKIIKCDDSISDKFFLVSLLRQQLENTNKKQKNNKAEIAVEFLKELEIKIEPYLIKEYKEIKKSDIVVNNKIELLNLKYTFIYDEKIIHRKEGLKVYVKDSMEVFELVGGIDNKSWKKI